MEKRFYVVFVKNTTRKQFGQPEWKDSWQEATTAANDFNKFNQDSTWNHVVAYAVDNQNHETQPWINS